MTCSFHFNFFDTPCHVEISSSDESAVALLAAYQEMFPWFVAAARQPARFTVRIRDIAPAGQAPAAADPLFTALRERLVQGYTGLDDQLLTRVCSPSFVTSRG